MSGNKDILGSFLITKVEVMGGVGSATDNSTIFRLSALAHGLNGYYR